MCGEKFETFWDEDEEVWKFRNATLIRGKVRLLETEIFSESSNLLPFRHITRCVIRTLEARTSSLRYGILIWLAKRWDGGLLRRAP